MSHENPLLPLRSIPPFSPTAQPIPREGSKKSLYVLVQLHWGDGELEG